jgi:hypothetical protein
MTPAGVSAGAKPDTGLVGGWKVQFADVGSPAESYVFLMSAKDASLRAVAVGWKDVPASSRTADDAEWWSAEVVTGKAGEHTFLNVRPLLTNGEPVTENGVPNPQVYFPLLYRRQDDGSIGLFAWGEARTISEAIKTGRISGTVNGGNVQITADSASLDAFLADAADSAFQVPYATLLPIGSSTAVGATSSASRNTTDVARNIVTQGIANAFGDMLIDGNKVARVESFEAYKGDALPDTEVATFRASKSVSIGLIHDAAGQAVYQAAFDGEADKIRLTPGSYRFTFVVTYDRCGGCRKILDYKYDLEAGHIYTLDKNEARYFWWALQETDIDGRPLGVRLF